MKGIDCQFCSKVLPLLMSKANGCVACILVMQDEPQDSLDYSPTGRATLSLSILHVSMWISAFASALVLLLSPVPIVRFMESDDDSVWHRLDRDAPHQGGWAS